MNCFSCHAFDDSHYTTMFSQSIHITVLHTHTSGAVLMVEIGASPMQ